jgi:hypothetical protein
VGGRFNRTDIKKWQHDLTRIPGELDHLNASIRQDQASSASVQERLKKEALVFLQPIDLNITALNSQLEILENNQIIQAQMRVKVDQQQIIDITNSDLRTVNSDLSTKKTQVVAIKHLQQIKSAQEVMQTHPPKVNKLLVSVASLSSSTVFENKQALNLSYRISTLQNEIANLEQQEALDRQKHAMANAHAYEHHHHDHHYDHHHGHHHHDDHQPSLFVSLLDAGEFVVDVVRSSTLASKRSELLRVIGEQSSHHEAANSYSQEYNRKNEDLARYQHELSQQQVFLVTVDNAQQHLASKSSSLQLAHDLSERKVEQDALERKEASLSTKLENANQVYRAAEQLIINKQNRNAYLAGHVENHGSNDDVEDLHRQLQQARALRLPYSVIESRYRAEDKLYSARIEESRRSIQRLTDLQAKQSGNRFLTNLRDNPQALVADFKTHYTNAVTTFDAEHPADQSAAEQTALVEMKNDVAYIQTLANQGSDHTEGGEGQSHEQKHEDDGLPHHPDRLRLYQLCGLVQAKSTAVAQAISSHSPLLDKLIAVTDQFYLDRDEIVAEYQKLARPLVAPEDMMRMNVGTYDTALAELRRAADNTRTDVKELRKLSETAKALANSIDGHKSHVEFNILLYTRMLNAAKALLWMPSSKELQNDFEKLAKLDKFGLASNGLRVGGVAFLFLGAVTLATSALADYGYIDIAIPEVAKAGYGVGGTGIALGLWSLFRGRERGSVKASHNFSNAASHVPGTLWVLQNPPPAASSGSHFGSSSSGAPKTLFTPSPVVVVVQPVQTNDSGYGATTDSPQHNMAAPLLSINPSAPPPEYSEIENTEYSPLKNRM